MEQFFEQLKGINTIDGAKALLLANTNSTNEINRALDFCIKAHDGQYRKSGEDYAVHPILVATIAANYGSDEAVLIAALLHDVVEDTQYTLEDVSRDFGEDVSSLVDGLTKVSNLREEKLAPSTSDEKLISSAMSFRKMLVASINDIRVLFVKLCDRLHNMLTLHALPPNKQKRIAEETLVVYAPIAHRLGIASIKNELEDLSFYYIFPKEYQKIEDYLQKNRQDIQLKLNHFIGKIVKLLATNGVPLESFKIFSRIKRHYSVYLKMQRKGVSTDEVLDLLAVRILVNSPIDCYKVLGIVHLNYKPIISRFKDYVTLPKENGYQTIHTTVFDEQTIFEIQIRTFDMHGVAEYGVAAHWKYKSGGRAPSLDWLNNLQYQDNNSLEEFYELAKGDLYSEEVMVYSPKGDLYTLPSGAVALDFAYAIHSEVGDRAVGAQIDKQKASLLSVLKNGNIVKIITGEQVVPRCSWIDAVKTSRAKSHIRLNCIHRLKDIDRVLVVDFLATVFERSRDEIEEWIVEEKLESSIYKASRDLNYFKELKNRLKNYYKERAGFFSKLKMRVLKLKEYKFENISVYSNYNISEISFDYCCHPKRGDAIMGVKNGSKVFIHHKLCENGLKEIMASSAVYVDWADEKSKKYQVVASLENKKGVLAGFLQFLADKDINVLSIELGKEEGHISYCSLVLESEIKDIKIIKNLILQKTKIIEIYALEDAYKGSE